ncbi:MAG: AAA family ATPase, partial [Burkholderiales bacterium]
MTASSRPSAVEVMASLTALAERGLLRRLDVALARFLHATVPQAVAPEVLLAAALLARAEGQGHSCWPLAGWLLADADDSDADEADAVALRAALAPLLQRLPTAPTAWRAALLSCAAVDDATAPKPDPGPLVLAGPPDRPRLYLRRYWQYEQFLLTQARARVALVPALDPPQAAAWLTRLFGPPDTTHEATPGAAPGDAIDWQRLACAATLRAGLTLITGGPGTGKTYTAARALALLFATDPSPAAMRVALAAPTGKAAARLAQSIAQAWGALGASLGAEPEAQAALADWGTRIGPAKTLHSLLGARPDTRHWRFDARHPLPLDVLVVDEASMVHLELMTALLQALPPQARLILLGDKDQLASVEAGAVLGDL